VSNVVNVLSLGFAASFSLGVWAQFVNFEFFKFGMRLGFLGCKKTFGIKMGVEETMPLKGQGMLNDFERFRIHT